MEAIILAGGYGTRLQSVVQDLPKSMALINQRPFLEYLLDELIRYHFSSVVLSVGYKREMIMDYFGSSYRDLQIQYAVEQEPLGTGGGVRLAFWKVTGDRAWVLNGDSLFRFDYPAMLDKHLKHNADVTMALRKLNQTGRYGRVMLNRNHRITGFVEKAGMNTSGLINGGVYILEKVFLMGPEFRGRFSLEKDCFEKSVNTSRLFGYPAKGYFLDIGIPEDYKKAQDEFKRFED